MLAARGARGGRGEEGQQAKLNAQQGRAGQEASLLSAPLGFNCNDGLSWQPVGWTTKDARWENPSERHSRNSDGIFRYLQLRASVSLP